MRYGNATTLLGLMRAGKTVTISVWKAVDGSTVTLSSNSCTEISSTGIYRWGTSNIQTQPTTETEYLYKMVNSALASEWCTGKFVLICPECYAPSKEEIRQEMDSNSIALDSIKKRIDDLEVFIISKK